MVRSLREQSHLVGIVLISPHLAVALADFLIDCDGQPPDNTSDWLTFSAVEHSPSEVYSFINKHRPRAILVGARWLTRIPEVRALLKRRGLPEPVWIPIDFKPTDSLRAEAHLLGLANYVTLQIEDLLLLFNDISNAIANFEEQGPRALPEQLQNSSCPREIRIVAVFRSLVTAQGLSAMLLPYQDINVVATCSSSTEAVKAIQEHSPHIVLLGTNCLDLFITTRSEIERIRLPNPRWAIASSNVSTIEVLRAIDLEIPLINDGQLTSLDQFVDRIRALLEATPQSNSSIRRFESAPAVCRDDVDRKILALVVQGKSNDAISQEVFLSLQTVKNRISRMMKTAGTSNRVELAMRFCVA